MSDHADDRADGADQKAGNDLVLSFLSVRRALGLLGYVLPVVLVLYGLIYRQWALASISAYFYSPMRELFVGILCAQAVFLWNYEGYKPDAGEILSDKIVSRAASLGALIVAFAPMAPSAKTAPPGGEAVAPIFEPTLLQTLFDPHWVGRLHFLGALLFFGALATYCLVNFRRGALDDPLKCAANRIYQICGWLILACILGIAALSLFGFSESAARFRAVFWLEVVACFAFATSWAVKGKALQPLIRKMAAPRA